MAGLYTATYIADMQQALGALLPLWSLSAQTEIKLLTVSENATFLATDPHQAEPIILRVHRPGYHSRTEIEAELNWLQALRADEVVVTPAVISTRAGDLVSTLQTQEGNREVVAFSFMSGVEPAPATNLPASFSQLGSISARLHLHAKSWQRPPGFRRKTWHFDTMLGATPLWGDWRAASGLTDTGIRLLERVCAVLNSRLDQYGMGPERFGLIHADLRLANLLIDGDQLGVIDFDDCGFSWFMYDFAAAISFIEEDPLVPELQQAWLEGYQSIAPLAAADVAMLPTFIMLRRLLLTAWLASHAETPTAQELGPTYTAGTLRLAEAYLSTP